MYTILGFVGSINILWIWRVFSSPIEIQFFPPSNDLYTPYPPFKLFLGFPSPVPTQITLGLLCWIATAPIEAVFSVSKIGFHFIPPLVLFQSPPEAVPTYITSGLSVTTSIEVTRPDIPPGPMFLGFKSFKMSLVSCCAERVEVMQRSRYIKVFFIFNVSKFVKNLKVIKAIQISEKKVGNKIFGLRVVS